MYFLWFLLMSIKCIQKAVTALYFVISSVTALESSLFVTSNLQETSQQFTIARFLSHWGFYPVFEPATIGLLCLSIGFNLVMFLSILEIQRQRVKSGHSIRGRILFTTFLMQKAMKRRNTKSTRLAVDRWLQHAPFGMIIFQGFACGQVIIYHE